MPRFPRLRRAGSEKVHVFRLVNLFNRIYPVLAHKGPEAAARVERRAMAMWPRLDHRALRRCHGDTARIAVHVSRRTKMTRKAIEMLIAD
jgi:hypothetical protein